MLKSIHIIYHPDDEYPYSIAGWNDDGSDFEGSAAELGLAIMQCATSIYEGLYEDHLESRGQNR